ncbi:pyruvate, water dikinase regulatory protein [Radiobacillus deserti]|uniref:Putative pyruvate, phosphate dikinase regulatory protein n=1 Tax=Radiobacillus deserti TaxID=2594883 RepID=A0A516KEV3_9BACI|nr:pyruvate, water dikinase regulatory protein [Radiobacillus deserti]QDP39933.1 kinase/pyrophosphorylase [Radiobacillus deserti]
MTNKDRIIYVCSDAVGETAEAVARATMRQFSNETIQIRRYGHVESEDQIHSLMDQVQKTGGIMAYTLVQPELREKMKQEAIDRNIKAVDVMGPLMQAYVDTYNSEPKQLPGLRHELDEDYFRRIEAIEFAVKYDDGRDARGFLKAQVVLVGVSRTSKTPISIFLGHKGIKVANLPILPDVKPPQELYEAKNPFIIGLTMDLDNLLQIRKERLKAIGLPDDAKYASEDQVRKELEQSKKIMEELNCPIINVSNKSIEETAGIIMTYLDKRFEDQSK